MAVDDAELLALAGGDSSSEDEAPQKSRAGPGRSDASRKRGSRPGRRKIGENGIDSADEARSNASTSQQSAAMSESEPEGMPNGADIEDEYPVDGKFYSEQEKQDIMAMPEIEREAILAERAQIAERKAQDYQLRRLLQARAESAATKRKGAPETDDSPRKSSRQKTTLGGRKVGEASKTIEAYKRQREEKSQRDQSRRQGANNDSAQRPSRASGDEAESVASVQQESDVEWDDRPTRQSQDRHRHQPEGEYNDFRRVTVTRFFLAEFCFHPHFSDKIRDCYVRLPQKSTPGSAAAVASSYQLVQINDIIEKEGWSYAIAKNNNKKVVTNQHLELLVEGSKKEFHMNAVSNSIITEIEVANYKAALADEGRSIPSQPFLQEKIGDINDLIHYKLTDDELQQKLQRSGVLTSKTVALDRVAILNRRRAAEEAADDAAVARCDAELANLQGPKLKYGTTLANVESTPPSSAELSQQARLAELNRQNRRKNAEEVRKAQLAEKRAARLNREAAQRGQAVSEDPMARVKTLSKTRYDVNESSASGQRAKEAGSVAAGSSRSTTPANGLGTPVLKATKASPEPSSVKPVLKNRAGLPILGNRKLDEDVIGLMDLGIDVDI